MKAKIVKYIIIYIILISSFVGLLTLTSSFSSEKMYENVKESSKVLLSEGNRKKIYIPYRQHLMEFDNYTDALMINTAYSIDDSTPLYSSFVARKNYIPGVTTEIYEDAVGELKSSSKYKYHDEVGELKDLVNGEVVESFEYARYWHGYLVILRPLLVLFNINQLRIILTILLVILAVVLTILISKKINTITAIIFMMGLIGVEYFYLGFSLQGIFIFIIMMISSIMILLKNNKMKDLGVLFFVTGILTNFFDFLTVPIVTLMVPLILCFLLKQKEQLLNAKTIVKEIITYSVIWGIGYGMTWLSKWILIDILFDKNMVSIAINQVLYRSINKANYTEYNIFSVIGNNLIYIAVPLYVSILCTILIIVLKILSNKYIRKQVDAKQVLIKVLPYIIISMAPFCWYILVQNHSYYHAFFTYRDLLVTNICFNIIIVEIFSAFIKM